MARKTVLIDDVDGTEGASNHSFSLDGRSYQIDLADKQFEKLQSALKPFIDAGTRSGGASRSVSTAKRTDLATIREWAGKQGLKVSPRGRISVDVLNAYDAAH